MTLMSFVNDLTILNPVRLFLEEISFFSVYIANLTSFPIFTSLYNALLTKWAVLHQLIVSNDVVSYLNMNSPQFLNSSTEANTLTSSNVYMSSNS